MAQSTVAFSGPQGQPHNHCCIFFNLFFFFFSFQPHPRPVEIPGPGIKPAPRVSQLWQYWTLNLLLSVEISCCLLIRALLTIWPQKYYVTFFFFGLFRAVPTAYGSSQARSRIRAANASLHHNHSHVGSKPYLSEPASSWILVEFITAEAQQELQLWILCKKKKKIVFLCITYQSLQYTM